MYWSTLLLACDFNVCFFKILSSNVLQIDWNLIQQHVVICWFFKVFAVRVLARSYLMTLHITFSIHVSFPIMSRCVFKVIMHRRNVNCFALLEKAFFSKRHFYGTIHACCIWLIFPFYRNLCLFFMFLYISFISYFYHIMFFTCGSFPVFVRGFY